MFLLCFIAFTSLSAHSLSSLSAHSGVLDLMNRNFSFNTEQRYSSVMYTRDSKGAQLVIDVPGYSKNDLTITLEGDNTLVVREKNTICDSCLKKPCAKGADKTDNPFEKRSCDCKEKGDSVLHRFKIPGNSKKIRASVQNGQLTVKIEFKEPENIEINLD
ncbi:MAG: Hsp20/alpha crystallin family protein [Alphaproteobacteria bacterium]|nr:Hsp20/alpha crystallin family protein [Alphaproteobacteria bacterium]